jgi:hypothetical protein
VLSLFLTLALQAATPAADPLAPARIGDLQCYRPDPVRKTCRSLAGYAFAADGKILNRAEVLLQDAPPVTMTTVAPVTIRDGAVCGPLSGIDKAQIAFRGRRIPEADAVPIRAQIQQSMADVLGQEVCTTYRRSGDWWIAEVTLNGVVRPDMQDTVMWVPASAGYTVQP